MLMQLVRKIPPALNPSPSRFSFYKISAAFSVFLLIASGQVNAQSVENPPDVIINEIMYNMVGTDNLATSEWVELYNNEDTAVDLTGYTFTGMTGTSRVLPPDTIISSKGYLILAANKTVFLGQNHRFDPSMVVDLQYPRTDVINNVNGLIELFAPGSATPFDAVAYSPGAGTPDWPTSIPGNSYELGSPSLDNSVATNWTVSPQLLGSPGRPNSPLNTGNTVITGGVRTEQFPGSGDAIPIAVSVSSDSTLSSVRLYVDNGTGYVGSDMINNGSGSYAAVLGPYANETVIKYYVEVIDSTGYALRQPYLAPEVFYVDDDPPGDDDLVVNEIMYNPAGIESSAAISAWIEYRNRRNTPINMSYYMVANYPDGPNSRILPEGTQIAANGYLILAGNKQHFLSTYPSVDPDLVFDAQWFDATVLSNDGGEEVPIIHANAVRWNGGPSIPFDVAQYFNAEHGWPVVPEYPSDGQSIELKNEAYDNSLGENWSASSSIGGTPAAQNSTWVAPPANARPFDSVAIDGTVTVGPGATYSTLASAANAFSAVSGGVRANWTILITSDLTETVSSTFGNTVAAGKTVTLRPAPGLTPTVTYTMATANASGINGGLIIGAYGTANTEQLRNTDSFIVDGSNTPGGTSRDLKLATVTQAAFGDRVIKVIGGQYGSIKNLTIESLSSHPTDSSFGIDLTTRVNAAATQYFVPKNWTIQNCHVTATSSKVSQGIGCTDEIPGVEPNVQQDIAIDGNTVVATTRGIFLNCNANTSVTNNHVKLNQTESGFYSIGIFHVSSNQTDGWTVNIAGNVIDQLITRDVTLSSAARTGIAGIRLLGGRGTYKVYNNSISGFAFAGTSASPTISFMRGIECEFHSNEAAANSTHLNVYHNSIHVPPVPAYVSSEAASRISAISFINVPVAGSGATCDVKNNLIKYDHNFGHVYNLGFIPALDIDYNVYDFNPAIVFAYNSAINNFPTYASWIAGYGGDNEATGFNPLTSAGSAWVSSTDHHFSPDTVRPAGLIAGTPAVGVTTDIDGETRSATAPMPGCDEVADVIPTAPTDVAVSKVGENLSVTWSDSTNEVGYWVDRTVNGGAPVRVATLPADSTSYTDEDVNQCSTYSYVITAHNAHAPAPSAAASFDNGEIPVITVTGDNPATVQQFSAYTDAGATAADACGSDITGDIEVSSNVDVNVVGAYQVTYTVTDANGKEDTEVRTVNVVLGPVAAPTAVSAGAGGGSGEIVVTWTDNANNETGYRILRSVNGAAAVQVAEIAAGSTSYVDTDINACSTYVYTVVAYHAENDASATAAAYDNGQLPTVTVLGDAVVTIEVGTAYVDAGATAEDACGNALTPVASGSVDSATVGTYSITYTATDANNKQQSATRTVHVEDSNVEKVDQAITFGALTDKTYGDAPITLSATASSGLLVSFTATGPATVSGSVLTIIGAGTVTVTASQAGGPGFNPAPDVTRTFSVAKANASISVIGYNGTYDGQPHTATGTAQGIEAEPVDLTSLLHITGTFTAVPGGTATWTFDGNENYNPASGSASIIIRSYLPLRPKTPTRP